jgi:SAM-dependent methyltransferase
MIGRHFESDPAGASRRYENPSRRLRLFNQASPRPWALASVSVSVNRWIALTEQNPGHSSWYVDRFRSMAAAGDDLGGEARLVDAMVARRSRVLDAGCGPGRVGSHLAGVGHEVVGVDIDPALIAAAEQDYPGPTWLVADLAELDLGAMGIDEGFDVVVCAGNVMTFLAPHTRRPVLERLAAHLRDGGRLVIGFGSGRDYSFAEFFEDAEMAGLMTEVLLSTWDLRPFTADSEFLVAVLSRLLMT